MFYKILVKYLKADRFIMNRYDPCVANKMVNIHQMKVVWHVGNLKALHKFPFEITVFTAYLESIDGYNM